MDFESESLPVSYVQEPLDGVQQKLARWARGQLPCFGRPVGIIINYTPDWAVRFDLNGQVVESYKTAYHLGEANLTIRGREISVGQLKTLVHNGGCEVCTD